MRESREKGVEMRDSREYRAGMRDQDSLSRPHANDSLKPTLWCHQSKS